jgi:Uma2 family endonuclease
MMELTSEMIERYEIEDFNQSKDMPSRFHARVQSNLAHAFYQFKSKYDCYTELSIVLQGKEMVVDVCLYPAAPLDLQSEDEVYVTTPPVVAVEILSPKQYLTDLTKKCKDFFAAGVQSYWLVVPALASVYVYESTTQFAVFTSGTIKDGVANLQMEMSEVFA